ncbi:MetQ/NlpA family ABC transporter substrate-binding protein [Microbacterium sp. zg.B48]|uniref:MetQ/NlpA family ABC transporter substrate-binding protein n=1 Tax=unclassified Microbacterium TaxID=2609290 RepID=UPI00214ACC79|nr:MULTISPECIES: MetQ/NlpA family ABC transporter substrate-binding protein [unclassified Microbacterium]MCR2763559.1 MetQ/NlpA family ABC transporter substrate-binding protein [Microbacterium sp. zg.B48]MCR2809281.1 MetQ/NlpA family ABC transporter substrate-binding protein [Microbacterium sp. zg.B185]WIM20424.1 MetQ/NlpA family ABC transporter substrate-binding protein [Microbacterium sp. zg-B185]
MSNDNSTHAEIDAHLAKKKSRRRIGIIVGVVAVIAIVAAITIPIVVQNSSATAGGDEELIPLTIADTAQSDFQDAIVKVGRENGLDIEFINFDDPYLPNTALVEGEVDANSFQHVAWLSQFNKENDADITPVFSTVISAWGLFSDSGDSVEDIPAGARIAVPDDPANFSRSLFILQTAGLLEVDPDAGVFPTEEDITANPDNIELVRIAHESVQTAYSDPTIDAVVVATDDFDPALKITSKDALVLEDSSAATSSPYVIVVATTADNADNPAWALLEKTYRDDRVVSALEKEKRGEATIVQLPVADLRAALAELTAQ